MAYFKALTTKAGIAPSEAWRLDYAEIQAILDLKSPTTTDISMLINAERKLNGATGEYLIQ